MGWGCERGGGGGGVVITWTELEALAFGGDVVRAGRDEERQLEELVALGIDVDTAPPAAELLQVFNAQDFANHFSHCFWGSLSFLQFSEGFSSFNY